MNRFALHRRVKRGRSGGWAAQRRLLRWYIFKRRAGGVVPCNAAIVSHHSITAVKSR